eukprot:425627_1
MKTSSGGSVSIHSKSEIIIQKDGAINANDCYFYSELGCVGGGTISLISDAPITNYGDITSTGTTGKCIGGPINIKCTAFRNFGRIESKANGRITIQCHSLENASDIDPQPILVMPWQFLMLDSTRRHLMLDEIPEDQRKDFVSAAMNARYRLK